MSKKYSITIKVDTNDGDYNTEVSEILEDTLNKLRPLIEAIKNFKPYKATPKGSKYNCTHHHNYPWGEYLPRTDLNEKYPQDIYPQFDKAIFELFEEYIPYGEHGFHSIKQITVQPFIEQEVLL